MSRPHVVRTCVGCRQRTAKSELLRVVLGRSGATLLAAPDPDGRAVGRGAHLHPTTKCLALAERRRAFARALRAEGSVDVSLLRRYVERLSGTSDDAEHTSTPRTPDVHTYQSKAARDQPRYRTTGRGSSGS